LSTLISLKHVLSLFIKIIDLFKIFILNIFLSKFFSKITFLKTYYSRNENLWQDGFILDFLQKKTIDIWIRKFLIYTGFLYSERFLFDLVIRFYVDNIIWVFHKFSLFELNNVSELLNITLYLYITVIYLYILLTYYFI